MIFLILTKCNVEFINIINNLNSSFNTIIVIPNDSSIKSFYNKFNPITYTSQNDLNNLFNNHFVKGFSLIVKDDETTYVGNTHGYSIFIKTLDNNELFIETSHFKKKCLNTPELLSDVITESFSKGHPYIGFSYNNTNIIIKGESDSCQDILMLNINHSKIKITPLANWINTDKFIEYLNRLRPSDTNIEFVNSNPDFFLVINETRIVTPPNRTIYFMMEPYGEKLYKNYLDRYSTPENKLLFKGDHANHLNIQEYWLDKSIVQLYSKVNKNNDLSNTLSVCISDKNTDPGHTYRINLIRKLDEGCSSGLYPIKIHIYGKCKSLNFKNYISECPHIDKSMATFPYKYHFASENNYIDNYITEKFYDALMSECYLFYKGASNANKYFNKAFTALSGDIDIDINTIISEMTNNKWEESISEVRLVKEDSLTSYNIFNRLESILNINRTVFIKLFKNNIISKIDTERYQRNGWLVISGSCVNNMSNFKYLESLLTAGLKYKIGVILSWKDNFEIYDKITALYAKNKNANIIQVDNDFTNLFENTVYITRTGCEILSDRIKSNNNITMVDLLKDITIVY